MNTKYTNIEINRDGSHKMCTYALPLESFLLKNRKLTESLIKNVSICELKRSVNVKLLMMDGHR